LRAQVSSKDVMLPHRLGRIRKSELSKGAKECGRRVHRGASRLASSRSSAKATSSSVAEAVSLKPRRPLISRVAASAGSAEFGIQGRGSSVSASARRPALRAPGSTPSHSGPQVRGRRGGAQGPQRQQGSARGFVGRTVRRLDSCPAPSRPIGSAESARYMVVVGWPRGCGPAVLQGASASTGRCLGSWRLFEVCCAARSWRRRDWLRRQGQGTLGSSGVGSSQRCKAGAGRHHNNARNLTRSA